MFTMPLGISRCCGCCRSTVKLDDDGLGSLFNHISFWQRNHDVLHLCLLVRELYRQDTTIARSHDDGY